MRYFLTALFAVLVTALVLTLTGNTHALPNPYPGKAWADFTLRQRLAYSRSNLRHARGVLDFAASHRELYRSASLTRVLQQHRRLAWKARVNVRTLEARLAARDHMLGCSAGACVETLIRRVWGSEGDNAIRVAQCEDPGLYAHTYIDGGSVTGQYVGIFQLGTSERRSWGHWPYSSPDASTALTASAWDQVVAGHELYLDLGWGPWECARIVGII